MSALTTRDALAKALTEHEYDVVTSVGAIIPACKCGWRAGRDWSSVEEYDQHVADALIASGVVVDAATLADDDALVAEIKPAVRAGSTERFAADVFADDGHDWLAGFSTRAALTALAAALSERSPR